ncbi:hypothetical protein [Mangrovimonas sp. TPBH4]|uniref:hypothetical protein n=1 Tax=Mangrovimonas sp. TPBH4 TaxID=1645914 RepID=UPI000AE522C8|nr:hypothetical protein [Mangrovimonas sp. TPBH4]
MKGTFNLRKPKDTKPTLIVFSAYFKTERKKFVYSTGESILPSEWDFENRQPNNLKGREEIPNSIDQSKGRLIGMMCSLQNWSIDTRI